MLYIIYVVYIKIIIVLCSIAMRYMYIHYLSSRPQVFMHVYTCVQGSLELKLHVNVATVLLYFCVCLSIYQNK